MRRRLGKYDLEKRSEKLYLTIFSKLYKILSTLKIFFMKIG